MSLLPDFDLDLETTADERPECAAVFCSNEAVWRYIWEQPCGCRWEICNPCKESLVVETDWWVMCTCGVCNSLIGRFKGWERL